MKAAIEKQSPKVRVTLIEGSGGAFEVKQNNREIFSKKKSGRFPDEQEILGLITDAEQ